MTLECVSLGFAAISSILPTQEERGMVHTQILPMKLFRKISLLSLAAGAMLALQSCVGPGYAVADSGYYDGGPYYGGYDGGFYDGGYPGYYGGGVYFGGRYHHGGYYGHGYHGHGYSHGQVGGGHFGGHSIGHSGGHPGGGHR